MNVFLPHQMNFFLSSSYFATVIHDVIVFDIIGIFFCLFSISQNSVHSERRTVDAKLKLLIRYCE